MCTVIPPLKKNQNIDKEFRYLLKNTSDRYCPYSSIELGSVSSIANSAVVNSAQPVTPLHGMDARARLPSSSASRVDFALSEASVSALYIRTSSGAQFHVQRWRRSTMRIVTSRCSSWRILCSVPGSRLSRATCRWLMAVTVLTTTTFSFQEICKGKSLFHALASLVGPVVSNYTPQTPSVAPTPDRSDPRVNAFVQQFGIRDPNVTPVRVLWIPTVTRSWVRASQCSKCQGRPSFPRLPN